MSEQMNTPENSCANTLKLYMDALGFTSDSLASDAVISPKTIGRILSGEVANPRKRTLAAVVKSLNRKLKKPVISVGHFTGNDTALTRRILIEYCHSELGDQISEFWAGLNEVSSDEKTADSVLLLLEDFYWNNELETTYPREVIYPNWRRGVKYHYVYPKRKCAEARSIYKAYLRIVDQEYSNGLEQIKFTEVPNEYFELVLHEVVIFEFDHIDPREKGYIIDLPIQRGNRTFDVRLSPKALHTYRSIIGELVSRYKCVDFSES